MSDDETFEPSLADSQLGQLAAYDERLRQQQSLTVDDEALEALTPELTKAMRALRACLSSPRSLRSLDSRLSDRIDGSSIDEVPTSVMGKDDTLVALSARPEAPERFQLLRELGSGGFGIVYQAYDTWLKRLVAIKFLRPELLSHAALRQRFLRESRAAARLNHPGIVRVLEVSETTSNIWQVCELVSGATLSQHIAQAALPADVAARLTRDLVDAVAHAHASNVLHRDIKPDNILLDCQPGQSLHSATPRLTDFGLARLTDIDTTLLSHTGMLVGTPRYMAPEQLLGKVDEHGPGTDIYAIGVVLYEMIAGKNPFGSVSSLQERLASYQQPIVYVRKLSPQVPKDLATICHKCLENRPERRYLSAVDLRDDLDRYLRGDPTKARPLPVHERLWRWSLRHRTTASVLTVLLVTSCLIFVQTLRNNAIYRQQNSQLSQVNQQLTTQEQQSRELAELADKLRAEALTKQERFAELAWKKGIREAYTAWYQRNVPEATELLAGLAASHPDAGSRFEWRLLEADIARQIKVLVDLPCAINEVRCIPNSQHVAAAAADGTVYIINIISGEIEGQIATDARSLHALAISPDGRTLAAGGGTQASTNWAFPKIYDLETLQLVKQLPGQATTIESLEFSADGRQLAVGCRYSTVKIYTLESDEVTELPTTRRNLWLAASPVSSRFAAQGTVTSVIVSSSDPGGQPQVIELPHDITVAAWLATSDDLLIATRVQRRALIETVSEPPRRFSLDGISATAEVMALVTRGETIAASLPSGELLLWHNAPQPSGQPTAPLATWKLAHGPIYSLAMHEDWVVAASHDGKLLRIHVSPATTHPKQMMASATRLAEIKGDVASHATWSSDGQHVLVNQANGSVIYLDVPSIPPVTTSHVQANKIGYTRQRLPNNLNIPESRRLRPAVELSPDPTTQSHISNLAHLEQKWTYCQNSVLEVFDNSPLAATHTPIFRVEQAASDGIMAVAFSPDGTQLAWTGMDSRLHIANLQADEPLEQSLKLKGQGRQLAWSMKGDRLAVTGQLPILELRPSSDQLTEVIDYGIFAECLAYTATDHIVSGHPDGTVRFVDPATGQTRILQLHPREVRSLLLLNDQRIGVSLDVQANLGVWFADGEIIGLLRQDSLGDQGYFSPKAWSDAASVLKIIANDLDGSLVVDTWNLVHATTLPIK